MLSGKEIIFIDEASTHLWEFKGRIWQPIDDPLKISIPKSRGAGLAIFGALSTRDNHFFFSICDEGIGVRNTTVE